MEVKVLDDADAVAREGAAVIAVEARAAVAARGRFIVAVSGGHTPWQMLRAMAQEDVPWKGVHVAQVDEHIAPAAAPQPTLPPKTTTVQQFDPYTGKPIAQSTEQQTASHG